LADRYPEDRVRLEPVPAGEIPEQMRGLLVTVIELKTEGEPRQVLGAGHVLIDDDPWR
jgi:hypothetical protein